MNLFDLPWIEFAVALAFAGALLVSRLRDPLRAFYWGVAIMGGTLACVLLAWFSLYWGDAASPAEEWSLQPYLFGRRLLTLDYLSAPLAATAALLHFLVALATSRVKMRRFSFAWSLSAEGIRLATFAAAEPWLLVALLAAGAVPGCAEFINRRQSPRVYLLHMALFAGLMTLGWVLVEADQDNPSGVAILILLVGILIHCGIAPAHCWLTDWFEHASFGNALLFVTPLTGVYAIVRLVLPIAPDWLLQGIGGVSLMTAVYAAGMAVTQQEARRFFAYLFLSHASLVLVGLELHTDISLTGALALWVSVTLSLGGFGLTLRAVEARFGRLSLADYHGLYDHSPALAVCFMLTGLASVGFPGTLGFVATEILVDGAVQANLYVGLFVVLAGMLNGIAVVRAYFRLFTGARHSSTVSLNLGGRERFAVLTLTVLIIGGGLIPQPGISFFHRTAVKLLADRDASVREQELMAASRERQ